MQNEEKKKSPNRKPKVKTAAKKNSIQRQDPLFNIVVRGNAADSLLQARSDIYTFILTTESLVIKEEKVMKPVLLLCDGNQSIAFERVASNDGGMICLFNSEFISKEISSQLKEFFKKKEKKAIPYIELEEEAFLFFQYYFKIIFYEYNGRSDGETGIIQRVLEQLVQRFIESYGKTGGTSKNELVLSFTQLLNNQFPVDHPMAQIKFTMPKQFAEFFGVHINYLNSTLKKEFGKTTTQIIQEKISREACALLESSTWSITEIGKALGFEYPQHFNAFFKKQMGKSPKDFRKENS